VRQNVSTSPIWTSPEIYLSNFIEVYSNQKMSGRLISYGCAATYRRHLHTNAKSEARPSGSVTYLGPQLHLFPAINLLNASAWSATPRPRKRCAESLATHDALYENPALRGYRRIGSLTLAQPWLLALDRRAAISSEIAVAHRQSIRRAFENQWAMGLSAKVFQQVDRFVFRPRADGHRNVDGIPPIEQLPEVKSNSPCLAASIRKRLLSASHRRRIAAWIHRRSS